MLKTKVKFIVAFAIIFIAICLLNSSKVLAVESNDNKILINNEIQDNLINEVLYEENPNGFYEYNIYVKGAEMIKLLQNTSLLDSLIKSDGYIYENVYVLVDNETSNATMSYEYFSNGEKKSEDIKIDIISMNNQKYAVVPLAVARKIDDTYYHAFLHGDGLYINTSTRIGGTLKTTSNSENVESIKLSCDIFEGDTSFYGAYVDIESTILREDYYIGGAGWNCTGGSSYNRNLAKGNCTIVISLPIKAGNSFDIEQLGTFTYVGINENDDYYKYRYELPVTDKTIFNQRYILCQTLLPEYNIMNVTELAFEGEMIHTYLIEKAEEETNIKIEGNNNTLPDNLELIANHINNYTNDKLENIKNYRAYNISLKSNNVEIQPNGNIKVSIPIPSGWNTENLVVYRAEENEFIKYDVIIKETDGQKFATFETNHFSTYILADLSVQNPAEDSISKDEKDDTPKTGITKNINILLISVILLSSIGAIAIIKKHK